MIDFATLALASLLSRRELRFDPVPEQRAPEDCGYAVVEALMPAGVRFAGSGGGKELSLAAISALLADAEIASVPRRLDLSGLDEALGRGLSPIVLHYDRPSPHWALLLGRGDFGYEVGDPARGLEILDRRGLSERFSGAALLVDPSTLDTSVRADIEAGRRRVALLHALLVAERGLAGPAPTGGAGLKSDSRSGAAGPAPNEPASGRLAPGRPSRDQPALDEAARGGFDLVLALGLAETRDGDFAGEGTEGSVEFRFSDELSGISMGSGLAIDTSSAGPELRPRLSFERLFGFGHGFATLGFAIGDKTFPALPSVGAEAGFLVDPLLVAIGARIAADADAGFPLSGELELRMVEVLNELFALTASGGVRLEPGAASLRLLLSVGLQLRAGAWGGGLSWTDSGARRLLSAEGRFSSPLVDLSRE